MNKFTIFCFPRTGSYRLVELINRASSVVCFGEVYKKKSIELPLELLNGFGLSKQDVTIRDEKPIEFYNKLIAQCNDVDLMGFKIFPNHNNKVYKYLLREKSIKNIFLARNPVQSFISLKVAQKSGIWVSKNKSSTEFNEKIDFKFEEFFEHVVHQYSVYQKAKLVSSFNDKDALFIDYSDTLTPEGVQSVYDFLEIDSVIPDDSSHKKIINKDYSDIVENWDDVLNYLKGKNLDATMSFYDFNNIFFQ